MAYLWPQDVLKAVEAGEIPPLSAVQLLRDMDYHTSTTATSKTDQQVEDILFELDQLIGLVEVKKIVRELLAFIEIQKYRQKERLLTEPIVLHMIFQGNPGTGKTTVARILGRILREIGVLSQGHLIEVERADLVGEYIGHTAQKTRNQFKKAFGGILFIDEAYSLARGGEKDFGKEAIDCMVKTMEDNKNDIILILAGYNKEMEDFLLTNPGLRSRFPIHIDFPDYSQEELLQIAEQLCAKREYQFSPQAKLTLLNGLRSTSLKHGEYFGNARTVRNMIEKALRRQAVRLVHKTNLSREELILLESCDFLDAE